MKSIIKAKYSMYIKIDDAIRKTKFKANHSKCFQPFHRQKHMIYMTKNNNQLETFE